MKRLRIASRGSALARWQAGHIAERLLVLGVQTEIQIIQTTGDRLSTASPAFSGPKGMFLKELEEALASGEADLAVHSLKDVPVELDPRFTLAAIPERADPRDVLVSVRHDSAAAVPAGARVGTSSLRRQAQWLALYPSTQTEPVRGNVDTRLRKLEHGEFAALLLAAAGLQRLGRLEWVREWLAPEKICPAPGQGALAVEVRASDAASRELLSALDHAPTRRAVECERLLLQELGGGCQVQIGALAAVEGDRLQLTAVVARPDGSRVLRSSARGPDGVTLSRAVAAELLRQGAREVLSEIRPGFEADEP